VEDGSCSASLSGDPKLGALADNGGPTQTHALLGGSPAINAGDDVICPTTDQRGIVRPQGEHCDIGAYEYEGPFNHAPTDITLSNNNVTENQPSGTTVGALTTTDPDAGDAHTYSLACTTPGADDASFQIGGAGGDELQTNAIFDYETKNGFEICVRTTDLGNATYDENFTITVNDLDEALPETSITSGPANPTSITSAVFTFTGSDDLGVDHFECQLDSGAYTTCTSPKTYTGLSAGVHTFSVRAVDGESNVDPTPATYSWRINARVTFTSNGAYDGWILESTETSSKGGAMNSASTLFYLGDNIQDKQYRAILHFDTSSLPDNATITKVTLKIRKQGLVGTDPFTTHGVIVVDIRYGAFGGYNALQLGDFQAAASMSPSGKIMNTPSGVWFSGNLWHAAFTHINKTGVTQFRLRFQKDDDNDNVADYLRFYSGNYAGVASRPQLIIEYYVP
jgi:hypothetical protein